MKFTKFIMKQNMHGVHKDPPAKGVKGADYLIFKKESDNTEYHIAGSRTGAIYIC